MKIVILGPAHPLRGGGMTTFNERLATQFMNEGHDVSIFSFSLQYPSFLFPGTTQFSNEPAPDHLTIYSVINSVNPITWVTTGRRLKNLKPDLVVVRYWLPFMGPALGTILRLVKKNNHTKIVCIADNVLPHEKRPGDTLFTRYFVKPVDAFVVMSNQVLSDLKLFTNKPARFVQHPLYDNFGEPMQQEQARLSLNIPAGAFVLLFFGFIRKYKGLDILLQALALVKDKIPEITLLIAGEYYDKPAPYQQIIEQNKLSSFICDHTHFIPNADVRKYFSAADVVVQPYRDATQSGVTPLAYHFNKPMIVTNVGGLPQFVPHGKSGLVAEPNAQNLAQSIIAMHAATAASFLPTLLQEKDKYSWSVFTKAITDLAFA